MLFQNRQLFPEEIPLAESVSFSPIDSKYLSVLQLLWCIVLSVILIILALPYFFISELQTAPWILAGSSLFLCTAFATILTGLKSLKRKGYAIRQHDLIYRSGWLFQSINIVPFSRIQHVAVNSGPLDRKYGLAKVSFFTAAGEVMDIAIPGLPLDEAYRIKEFVMTSIKSATENERLD